MLHAHDWQAGLAIALLHYGGQPRPRTVMTVHNLAFQGVFPGYLLPTIGLPSHAWSIDGVEYHGAISYLKAGLQLADRITTVSPSYAAEIRTPEGGMGFDGLLRARAGVLTGILNGIDETVWNPATDTHLASRFDARRRGQRAPNKAALQARLESLGANAVTAMLLMGSVGSSVPIAAVCWSTTRAPANSCRKHSAIAEDFRPAAPCRSRAATGAAGRGSAPGS